jgi:hypothetical protein
MSAPPPPHRLALEACRSQLHVRARALHSPCSVTSSARPSAGRFLQSGAGGIRTHGLELMRLARTAAPLPRKVWLAGLEPAVSGFRSRRDGHAPPQPEDNRRVPPAGLEPAASGLRARRHRQLRPRGRAAPAAGLEPALSRVTVARLTDSTTPERKAEAAGLEPANGREAVCAVATRCLSSSAMPPHSGRRGSRTPKTREPTRFRDGIPRRWQSFPRWPRQASNLQPSA